MNNFNFNQGEPTMKKKLFITPLILCTCFCVTGIGVFANTFNNDTEQEINLDEYMQGSKPSTSQIIYGVKKDASDKQSMLRSRPKKPNARKGYFWVEWEPEKLHGYFDNNYYQHRVSLKNSNSSKYYSSSWTVKGKRAHKWIYSTLTGNKAKWSTR